MNNRVNQAILVFAIIVILAWNYMRYKNNKLVEKYEMDKSQIMSHIQNENKIDSILVMTSAAKLTSDDAKIQNAYDLAEAGNREELVKFFETI